MKRLFLAVTVSLLGCATQNTHQTPQLITQSMVSIPAEPPAPNPDDADQRDVAVYLILLRVWGRTMATQLNAISVLLK